MLHVKLYISTVFPVIEDIKVKKVFRAIVRVWYWEHPLMTSDFKGGGLK